MYFMLDSYMSPKIKTTQMHIYIYILWTSHIKYKIELKHILTKWEKCHLQNILFILEVDTEPKQTTFLHFKKSSTGAYNTIETLFLHRIPENRISNSNGLL